MSYVEIYLFIDQLTKVYIKYYDLISGVCCTIKVTSL